MAFPAILINLMEDAEEEDIMRENTIIMRTLRNTVDPFFMTDKQFVKIFRLSKDAVEYLCDALQDSLRRTRTSGLSVQTQILAALRFFAIGSYQKSIGNDYLISISQPATSRAIRAVAKAITERLSHEWICFPTTEEKRAALKRRFQEARNFKGVISYIDCTHVSIIKPTVHEELYANYKGFHSLNVQAVASHDLEILNVNTRFPGTTHDSFIWKHSAVRDEMLRLYETGDRSTWLLGDSGYGLEPWLMTPIINAAEGSAEERYTRHHASTRNCVERMFGELKNIWRCLLSHRVLHYDPITAACIVIACCVLHNIRLHHKLLGMEVDIDEEGEAAALQRFANLPQRLRDVELEANEEPIGDRLLEARRIQTRIPRTQFGLSRAQ